MAKTQLKSDGINPFGGLFSILNIFNRSGLRTVIDQHLGRRGMTKAAFTHGDVFASMFGSYLCGGDAWNALEKVIVWGVLNESGSLIMRHQWSSRCENEASEAVNRTCRTK